MMYCDILSVVVLVGSQWASQPPILLNGEDSEEKCIAHTLARLVYACSLEAVVYAG